MKPEVVFVNADDWVGMYIGGQLVMEGHSFDPQRVAEKLGWETRSIWADTFLTNRGSCPELLETVVADEPGDTWGG